MTTGREESESHSDSWQHFAENFGDKGRDTGAFPISGSRKRQNDPLEFEDFEILQELGQGGMAQVYKARPSSEKARRMCGDRLVALKVIALDRSTDFEKAVARFRREAQALSKLDHRSIARLYGVDKDPKSDRDYIAMEYIDGLTFRKVIEHLAVSPEPDVTFDSALARLVPRSEILFDDAYDQSTQPFTPRAMDESGRPVSEGPAPEVRRRAATQEHVRHWCELVRDAARALDDAHLRHVVHRDIKPENMMIVMEGQGPERRWSVRLIDFGIARFLGDERYTTTGKSIGTPAYMSPEQLNSRTDVDHRTDIYSLGIVLYEFLASKNPFADAPLSRPPLLPITWLDQTVGKRLQRVVHKATHPDRAQRYQSAADLANDLQKHLEGTKVSAPRYRYKSVAGERRPGTVKWIAFMVYTIVLSSVFSAIMFSYFIIRDFNSGPMFNSFYENLFTVAAHTFVAFVSLWFVASLRSGRNWARVAVGLVAASICTGCFAWLVSICVSVSQATIVTSETGEQIALILACLVGFLCLTALIFNPGMRDWCHLADEERERFRRAGIAKPRRISGLFS